MPAGMHVIRNSVPQPHNGRYFCHSARVPTTNATINNIVARINDSKGNVPVMTIPTITWSPPNNNATQIAFFPYQRPANNDDEVEKLGVYNRDLEIIMDEKFKKQSGGNEQGKNLRLGAARAGKP